jgi:acyl-coenzyme A synthetase/AMP-(fatty) acid ligase
MHSIAITAEQLPDSPYAINICTNRFAFAVGFFAALLRGQTNVLLPGPGDNIKEGAQRSFPDAYFLDDTHIKSPDAAAVFQRQNIQQRFADIPPAHAAAIVFSSGTTGLHKQITKSWGSLYGGAGINQRCLAPFVTGNAAIIATVPPWHMYGLEWSVMLPFRAGFATYTGSTLYPEDIRVGLETAGAPRVLLSTPLHLRALLDSGTVLPAIELVLSATAPLDTRLADRIETSWGCTLLEIYGCSEVGSMAHRQPTHDVAWEFFEELVVTSDTDGVTVAYPHSGESARLSDHLEFSEDGRFEILGRDDDMVKVAGKRGSLASINNALLSIKGVADGIIYTPASLGLADTGRLAAVVVTEELTIAEVRTALQALLDPIFMPRPIRLVEALPRNATGKLARDALRSLVSATDHQAQNHDR